MSGKKIRIERIIGRKSGRTIIIPMDHGTSLGPIKGLIDIKKAINDVVEGGANAILLHKGMVHAGHRGGRSFLPGDPRTSSRARSARPC